MTLFKGTWPNVEPDTHTIIENAQRTVRKMYPGTQIVETAVIATGVENGQSYVDIQIRGTRAPIHVKSKGEHYDVLLSRDGDHIVTKRDKRDHNHSFVVGSATSTWERVVGLAKASVEAPTPGVSLMLASIPAKP